MKSNHLTGNLVIALFLILASCSPAVEHGEAEVESDGSILMCEDGLGYTAPIQITSVEMTEVTERFRETYPDELVYGGLITRDALDEMLCGTNANAVMYFLAKGINSDGTHGPMFVVLAGALATGSPEDPEVSITSEWYKPNNWCPPTCPSLPGDTIERIPGTL